MSLNYPKVIADLNFILLFDQPSDIFYSIACFLALQEASREDEGTETTLDLPNT